MTEKYIDLYETISDDMPIRPDEVSVSRCVLEWLDEHPERAPGRTVTESEVRAAEGKLAAACSTEQAEDFLLALGVTVVPDPEPTNAEKLSALYDQWLESDAPACRVPFEQFMDEAGVKAPGGDDDH